MWNQSKWHLFTHQPMLDFILFTLLVRNQEYAPTLISEGNRASRSFNKIVALDLAAVDEREHKAICDNGPEYLNDI